MAPKKKPAEDPPPARALMCTCGNRFLLALQLWSETAPEPTAGSAQRAGLPLPLWCPGCGNLWTWNPSAGKWTRALVTQNLVALRQLSAAEA